MSEKVNEILDAASQVFSDYGYKKTSMQDIGDRLGMTKSNLYIYFKNKEDLYKKSVSYQLLKWEKEVEKSVQSQKYASDKFETVCRKSFEYIGNNEILKRLAEKDRGIFSTNHDDDRFIDVNSRAQQILKDIIAEGIKTGEFRTVDVDNISEYLFSNYMMFLIKLYSKKDKYVTDKLVDDAIDLLKHGLLKK
ncbi:MAG: TetR/AcrR family transcriptional regulator [Clostridia bacterium]|nr:TetR/AcrR family transcriptional regulator [Clostridia bacterium]